MANSGALDMSGLDVDRLEAASAAMSANRSDAEVLVAAGALLRRDEISDRASLVLRSVMAGESVEGVAE